MIGGKVDKIKELKIKINNLELDKIEGRDNVNTDKLLQEYKKELKELEGKNDRK